MDTTIAQKTEAEELSDSPRHHEWVTLSHGDREFQAFVVYPETDEATKSVIVIHENRGLNDWARLFADKLAEAGYLVIAPDLISNTQEGKRRTTDFENPDAARDAIYALDPEQVTADLDAAFKYIKEDSASTGEVAVAGFCWGGSQTFRYATNNQDISSAHVFYGTGPEDEEAIANISAPVYGYYGGDDNRVNSTIEASEKMMEKSGKTYKYEIYEDAGHAFMRSGHQTDAEKANKEAHDKAWNRLKDLLK
ncbi:carboxymethylenebutenolidase [Salegentibacter salinarum]|uniref:Carboxymethylenebutenolidase n=1 Tax=Salegentibacter salinarum TaxID=447422 RepID=A0A2N0U1U0_9FLAO|nr:carboxymethylenebutenolidase [Salegentibacter salinarum]